MRSDLKVTIIAVGLFYLRNFDKQILSHSGKTLKKFGLIGFLSFFVLFPRNLFAEAPAPVVRLTLKEAIESALRSHPSLQVARGTSLAQEARLGEAKANFYPRLDLTTDYKRATSNSLSFFGGLNQFGATLSLQQRIYDFGKTGANVEAAREGLQANRWDEEAARLNVIVNVRVAYFGLLAARRLAQVNEETVRQFEEHLAQAQGFFQVGTRPKFDVTKAEVDLTNAKLNLIKAKNTADVARAQLSNAIGLPDRPIEEIEELLGFEKVGITEKEALNEALRQRPELLSLKAKERAAEASVRSARRNYFPVLSGTADYTYSGQEFPLIRNWDVGARLTFPLFSGYLQQSQVAEANANQVAARANAEGLRQDIFLAVRQAYSNLLEAEERVRTSEVVVRQAEENLALANGRFQTGVGGSLERTDAQVLLINAKTSQTQALYDYRVAEAHLEKAMGRR